MQFESVCAHWPDNRTASEDLLSSKSCSPKTWVLGAELMLFGVVYLSCDLKTTGAILDF